MKPTCILTIPRTGSQLVLGHFYNSGYDDAAELLNLDYDNARKLRKIGESGKFCERYTLEQIAPPEKFHEFNHYLISELKARVASLVEMKRPIIVKAFIDSHMFAFNNLAVEYLFNHMDVIVLQRRNAFKGILSYGICGQVEMWHPSPDKMAEVKDRLKTMTFSFDEQVFLRLVQANNLLHTVSQNLKAFSATARAIYYEDFQADPVNQLNALLGTNFSYEPHMTTFIDDHAAHVTNLDRLKELYRKFSLSQ